MAPESFGSAFNMALAAHQAGNLHEAQRIYQQLLLEHPLAADVWHMLGLTLRQLGHDQQALAHVQRSIALNPGDPAYYSNQGRIYAALRQLPAAEASYRQALEREPALARHHYELGLVISQQGRRDEAIGHYRRAIELDPACAEAWSNLGAALGEGGEIDTALAHFRRAIELEPRLATAHFNLGVALKECLRLDEALAAFETAIELEPNYADAHFYRAMVWLAQGDWQRGWPEYEWRWTQPGSVERLKDRPEWDGSPLAGRSILVYGEQGFGDTLQFVRFVEPLRAAGARVKVRVLEPLRKLLAGSPSIDEVVVPGEPLPACDLLAPLLSLPRLLQVRFDSLPNPPPYLQPEPAAEEVWRNRLAQRPGCKVGFCWHGNPRNRVNAARSCPLDQMLRLARIDGVQLYSLQLGEAAGQWTAMPEASRVVDLSSSLIDFHETAAVLKNLDLLITTDSAPAHLAGALGVPVWTALHFAADWRWLVGREDSPWYPTMRLFRQRRPDDWPEVFDRIEAELRQLVIDRAPTR